MNVKFTKSFAKDLRRYRKNNEFLKQVRNVIENVEQARFATDLTGLRQLKAEGRYYRMRVGDFRIGVSIEGDVVTFVRVLHRREIYRFFP